MEIIERLNKFLRLTNLSKSQFADTCGIPRPTVSQLFSGRNKKINNELIEKIHVIFPNLSLNWLLFGEGNISMNPDLPLFESETLPVSNEDSSTQNSLFELNEDLTAFPHETMSNQSGKKIMKIVVFYSDNSFEEFYHK